MKFSARDLLYVIETDKIKQVFEDLANRVEDIENNWENEDSEHQFFNVKMLLLYQMSIKLYNDYTPSKQEVKLFPKTQKLCDKLGWVYKEEINI